MQSQYNGETLKSVLRYDDKGPNGSGHTGSIRLQQWEKSQYSLLKRRPQ